MYGMKTDFNFITPLTAYECLKDKLVFDIDSKFIELGYGDKISFVHCEELISDTIVKGLVPKRYGGLESQNILVIIDDSCGFDFYQCVNVAKKRYGLDTSTVLDRTIIIRVFTIYQLAETIVYELSRLVSKFKSKLIVVISDLFLSESHIKTQNISNDDRKLLVRYITESLNNIINSIVIVFSSTSIPNFRNYKKNSKSDNRDEL